MPILCRVPRICLACLLFVGCAQQKRDEPRRTADGPQPRKTQPAPTTAPSEPRHTEPQPATASAPTNPESAPPPEHSKPQPEDRHADIAVTEKKPGEAAEPPEYIVVLERFTTDRSYQLEARSEAETRLTIRTDNIKRLQIRRSGSGLSAARSIAILIDNQGIEWVSRLEAVELERSINGAWRPIERK